MMSGWRPTGKDAVPGVQGVGFECARILMKYGNSEEAVPYPCGIIAASGKTRFGERLRMMR